VQQLNRMMFSGTTSGDEGMRAINVRRGRRLEYLTIGWNLLEGGIALGSGYVAGSISLVGFGVDSFIESLSGGALLWRLHFDDPQRRKQAETATLKLVGLSFILLAFYVGLDAAKALIQREEPDASYVGIVLAVLTLVMMPMLAAAKRRVAVQIRSRALIADSRQTILCACLSAILLGGLLLNAMLGWWWADPVCALLMTPIIAREGIEALRNRACC